ncbi:tetratricopeptide repeat protein [Sphingosinicella sp.]|uniref:tetratricopeptide repeat protein n=1 Tax=Sphingosinicella sp. TaxID=1917971 RepID=UPI00403814B3
MLLAAGSSAAFARTERAALESYVQARAASSAGAMAQASARFAAALAAAPDNEIVAGQALRHAVIAGDWPLAVRAARITEARGAIMPDARFLLLADAVRERDWARARTQLDAIERDRLFAFAVPVLRAWIAQGSGQGDPIALLPAGGGVDPLTAGYVNEQRPFLLIAARRPEALEAARVIGGPGPRALRLRLAAAAALARRGDRTDAIALLQGDDAPTRAARSALEGGRPIPGAVNDARSGVAEILQRIALDLNGQQVGAVAATFASLSTWLAPDNGVGWMIAAELASQQDRRASAIEMLGHVAADDPFADMARDQRIRLLVAGGGNEEALQAAQAAATAAGATASDQVRLGEVLMAMDRPREAATAFARAIETRTDASQPEWTLWLLAGGAHDEAEDWPQARAALQRAYSLAPTEPLVLNYLGYAQLERRENMEEAERLVREAHRLAPENAAITDSLGWALFLRGRREEGLALLERAAEASPADVEINEHLGDAYYAMGRRVEARFAWAAARVHAEGADRTRLEAKIDTGLTPALAAR